MSSLCLEHDNGNLQLKVSCLPILKKGRLVSQFNFLYKLMLR